MKTTTKTFAPGFTLTEVTIAIAIFAFAVAALVGVLAVGMTGARDTVREAEAIGLAQEVFSDLELAHQANQWPSPVFGIEWQQGMSSRGELYLTTEGLRVNSIQQAAYRFSYRQEPVGDNLGEHVHLRVTWPAPAPPADASGDVELVHFLGGNS